MKVKVYIAILPTRYEVYGVGTTPEQARAAACRLYRASNNSGYGFPLMDGKAVRTNAQIAEWFGLNVYGPVAPGEAVSQ